MKKYILRSAFILYLFAVLWGCGGNPNAKKMINQSQEDLDRNMMESIMGCPVTLSEGLVLVSIKEVGNDLVWLIEVDEELNASYLADQDDDLYRKMKRGFFEIIRPWLVDDYKELSDQEKIFYFSLHNLKSNGGNLIFRIKGKATNKTTDFVYNGNDLFDSSKWFDFMF